MAKTTFALVFDQQGIPGLARTEDLTEQQAGDVEVLLQNRSSVLVPLSQVQQQEKGVYEAAMSFAELDSQVATRPDDALVIPVLVEQARIDKRWVETGRIRVTKSVHEEAQDIEALLREESVDVQRIPINRPLDAPVETRYEGDVLVIPLVEEELIVEKRLILREEIRVTKRETQRTVTETAILRKESVDVQRLPTSENEDIANE